MKVAFTATTFASGLLGSLAILAAGVGCAQRSPQADAGSSSADALVGAWRSHVQFHGGAFASVKGLSFMYVFNSGGTMTESSNYDADPPVPPAYGSWRRTAPNEFEAHYEFFVTKPPAAWTDLAAGNGWPPAGRGVLVERISLATDGHSFTSKLTYSAFDAAGSPAEGGGEADVVGKRIGS